MGKDTAPATGQEDHKYSNVITLIETLRRDGVQQYGDMKQSFGSMEKRLNDDRKDIDKLLADKIARDAVDKYRKENPAAAQKKDDAVNGTITLNKELLKAIGMLLVVIGVLVAALQVLQ